MWYIYSVYHIPLYMGNRSWQTTVPCGTPVERQWEQDTSCCQDALKVHPNRYKTWVSWELYQRCPNQKVQTGRSGDLQCQMQHTDHIGLGRYMSPVIRNIIAACQSLIDSVSDADGSLVSHEIKWQLRLNAEHGEWRQMRKLWIYKLVRLYHELVQNISAGSPTEFCCSAASCISCYVLSGIHFILHNLCKL